MAPVAANVLPLPLSFSSFSFVNPHLSLSPPFLSISSLLFEGRGIFSRNRYDNFPKGIWAQSFKKSPPNGGNWLIFAHVRVRGHFWIVWMVSWLDVLYLIIYIGIHIHKMDVL